MQKEQQNQKHIKAVICQLNPKLKQKTQNIARVKKSLQNYSKADNLDLILFPEMSFTGYNFKDKADAQPMAVQYADLQSEDFSFAIQLAKRLNCYVVFGYMQKQQQKLYNSAAVIDRSGTPILNYRKAHLYFCDALWAEQGTQFASLTITNTKGETFKTVLGICMDINPKNFTSGKWEWADFANQKKAELLLFLTNWVDHQPERLQEKVVIAMYDYWLHRMEPILQIKSQKIFKNKCIFLAADRVGKQYSFYDKQEKSFFGSSVCLYLNPPVLIKNLSKRQQSYLVVDAKIPKQQKY